MGSAVPKNQISSAIGEDKNALLERVRIDGSRRNVVDYMQTFQRFDRLRSGTVTTHHFDAALTELGFTWLSLKELAALHEHFAVERSGLNTKTPGSGRVNYRSGLPPLNVPLPMGIRSPLTCQLSRTLPRIVHPCRQFSWYLGSGAWSENTKRDPRTLRATQLEELANCPVPNPDPDPNPNVAPTQTLTLIQLWS